MEASVVLPATVSFDRLMEIQSCLSERLSARDMDEYALEMLTAGWTETDISKIRIKFSLVVNPNSVDNTRKQLLALYTSLTLIGDVGIDVSGLRTSYCH